MWLCTCTALPHLKRETLDGGPITCLCCFSKSIYSYGCERNLASACFSVLELSQTIAMILMPVCLSVLELSRTIAMDAEAF
jgi:hypothetical protein